MVAPLLSRLPRAQSRLYDVVVDRTVAAIEALATESPAPGCRAPERVTTLSERCAYVVHSMDAGFAASRISA
ncbi:hypothetical protein SANTM175S_08300 [Streptomyces antimycoticus]